MEQQMKPMQWSSKHPGLQIYLIDQSHSMREEYPEQKNKAEFAATVINRNIAETILMNSAGEEVKNRERIIIIGYGGEGGDSVNVMRNGMLSHYADHPLRMKKTLQKVSNGDRGLAEIEVETPIFIEALAKGSTAMGKAFHLAYGFVQEYVAEHPNGPSPHLINITDGSPWSYELGHKEVDYAIEEVKRIMALKTIDGYTLVLNAHIGTGHPQYICPGEETALKGRQANFLYEISSEIPEALKVTADKFGIVLGKHARGFVSNASPDVFIKFINFGSSGGLVDRISA